MKKWIVALVLLLALGFGIYEFAMGLKQPEIREISHSWGEVTGNSTEINTKIVIYNANPFSVPVKRIIYEIYMNDIKMAAGQSEEDIMIKEKDETAVSLRTTLDNTNLPRWWATHINNGERTEIKIEGRVIFDLRGKEFEYPFKQAQNIDTNMLEGSISNPSSVLPPSSPTASPTPPQQPEKILSDKVADIVNNIQMRSISNQWGKATEETTIIKTEVKIYNGNDMALYTKEISFDMQMNNISMIKGKSQSKSILLQPEAETTIPIDSEMDNTGIPGWWVSHLKNKERTYVNLETTITLAEIEGIAISIPPCRGASKVTVPILNVNTPIVCIPTNSTTIETDLMKVN